MKRKAAAFGLLCHVISYYFGFLSLGNYSYAGKGVSPAFGYWIYCIINALLCLLFYLYDALRLVTYKRSFFNIFRMILVILAGFLCLFVGGSLGVMNSIIWQSYFAIVFVVQILSMFVIKQDV